MTSTTTALGAPPEIRPHPPEHRDLALNTRSAERQHTGKRMQAVAACEVRGRHRGHRGHSVVVIYIFRFTARIADRDVELGVDPLVPP